MYPRGWKWCDGESHVESGEFAVSMEVSKNEFDKNITFDPRIGTP